MFTKYILFLAFLFCIFFEKANAGPAMYATCIAGCTVVIWFPPAYSACIAGCAGWMAVPGP